MEVARATEDVNGKPVNVVVGRLRGDQVGDELSECRNRPINRVAWRWLCPVTCSEAYTFHWLSGLNLCFRMISSPYFLLKSASFISSCFELSIAKNRSLYADNSRSKGCLTVRVAKCHGYQMQMKTNQALLNQI